MHGHTRLVKMCKDVATASIYSLEYLPGGYNFLYSLPKNGKQSRPVIIRNITNHLISSLFPLKFRTLLLKTCLGKLGTPDDRTKELYIWVLHNVYNDHVDQMYKDWLKVK